jgi:hypothetical protein
MKSAVNIDVSVHHDLISKTPVGVIAKPDS